MTVIMKDLKKGRIKKEEFTGEERFKLLKRAVEINWKQSRIKGLVGERTSLCC
jgi:hypothetical protein